MSFTSSAGTPQPIRAWSFDGTTTDYITGSSGTVIGTSPSYVSGVYKQALYFPNTAGATPTSNISYTLPSLSSTAFTVALWFNASSLSTINYPQIFAMTGLNAESDLRIEILPTAGPTFTFRSIYNFSASYVGPTTSSSYNIGTWIHLAATVQTSSTSNVITLYVNGSFVGNTSSTTNTPRTFSVLTLGSFCDGKFLNAFNGSIDDLRIFNTALTAAQVQAIYNAQGMPRQMIVQNSSYIKNATGGDTVQDIGGYRIHTFTTVGTSTFTPATSGLVEVLVVAGGGGGGSATTFIPGGGGGAGEVYYAPVLSLSQSAYTINIGSGGSGSLNSIVRTVNGNSSNIFLGASPIISTNGGGGGGNGSQSTSSPQNIYQQPQDGGSGGGCGRYANVSVVQAISITTSPGGLGNPGGFPGGQVNRGSGGGGATSAGGAGVNNGAIGLGGSGFSTAVSGSSQTYGTGGNGGNYQTGGAGANGGANTGNGGAGADGAAGAFAGGNGGSGIVIVRYPIQVQMTGAPLFSQLSASAVASSVGAFSLRAVNGTTVKAVQVRNGTTSATQDFYADRLGNLLTAPVTGQSLANWLGGATGYVTTWYDQSGKGNHASQATAANQPIIQRATKGPGYSILFNGTTNYLTGMSYTVLNGTNYSFSLIDRRNTNATTLTVISSGSAGADQGLHFQYLTPGTTVRFGQYSDDIDITPYPAYVSNEPLHYWTGTESSTTGRFLYEKGTLSVSNVLQTTLLTSTSGNFVVGRRFLSGSTYYYSGEIFEVIVYTSALGTSDITQIYNNQLSYTGT